MSSAFLFPGQGAQFVGMGATLVATLPAAQELFQRGSAILGFDLLGVCLNGPAERLNATDVSQPAIFVASLAALEQLKATSPEAIDTVSATAGLSLGEYTALVFAGAISFEDALKVVKARGEAMQAAALAAPGAMAAVLGLEVPEVESLVAEARSSGLLEVANLLCPGNTVVSGAVSAVDRFEQICQERGGIRTARLAVAGAFHTTMMKPADDRLAEALDRATFASPKIPVWSNVDGQPHTNPAEIRSLLVKQVLSPVQWELTVRGMMAVGVDQFYEIGPGRVLAGLIKRVNRKANLTNVAA
jgi:[acyl-carrier-protein] S-malonyltransferase